MAPNLQIQAVTHSIAALAIAGVTIHDTHDLAESYHSLGRTLAPRPNEFVTDFVMERMSFGGGPAGAMDVSYTLHYIYYYAPLGMGNFSTYFDNMLTDITAIWEAVLLNDSLSGCVDIVPDGMGSSPVVDPSGESFYGCELSFRVLEHAQ